MWRPEVELMTIESQLQCPNHETTEQHADSLCYTLHQKHSGSVGVDKGYNSFIFYWHA